MKAIVIQTNGLGYEAEMSGLEDYQKAVGGYIEAIPFGDRCTALINEEGKIEKLPRNQVATIFCHKLKSIFPDDFIVGPMVVIGNTEDGEWTDIPKDVAEEITVPF